VVVLLLLLLFRYNLFLSVLVKSTVKFGARREQQWVVDRDALIAFLHLHVGLLTSTVLFCLHSRHQQQQQ